MEGKNVCTDCGSCHDCNYCGCIHHKMTPIAVLLIALMFVGRELNLVSADTVAIGWPIVLALAAAAKIVGGKCKCYGQKI